MRYIFQKNKKYVNTTIRIDKRSAKSCKPWLTYSVDRGENSFVYYANRLESDEPQTNPLRIILSSKTLEIENQSNRHREENVPHESYGPYQLELATRIPTTWTYHTENQIDLLHCGTRYVLFIKNILLSIEKKNAAFQRSVGDVKAWHEFKSRVKGTGPNGFLVSIA